MDLSSENFNSLKACQEILLNQALKQGIQRNEEQCKIWTDCKKRHKKVIEALEKLPLELSVNCMVPIGKLAFMKGKLIHTNEILACIGDAYFAKYSAAQAIALCKRRIQTSDEMLKHLEKERDLYETRQLVCSNSDVFGEKEKPDFFLHWSEQKLNDWRVEHRRREKEYRQKLSKLKNKEKTTIRTEEDLFRRLDELELQEELADEVNRMADEDEHEDENCYGEELEEGEEYDESNEYNEFDEEEEDDEDDEELNQDDYEEIERELNKLREIRMSRKMNEQSTKTNITNNISNTNQETDKIEENTLLKTIVENSSNNFKEENESMKVVAQPKITSDVSEKKIKSKEKERRVSFAEPNISTFDANTETNSLQNQDKKQSTVSSNDDSNDSKDNNDDDIIRIEFKHTDNNFIVPEITGNEITSPGDIYRIFSKPKSILKRSPNDVMPLQNISLPTYSSGEEDEDEEEERESVIKPSAYNSIVKNISERELATAKKTKEEIITEKKKRSVSKFKMERLSCVK